MLNFKEFAEYNKGLIPDGRIMKEAYKNYLDVTTRHTIKVATLRDLFDELKDAREKKIPVQYVMGVDGTNFSYVGWDLDLTTLRYVEAIDSLYLFTKYGNELIIPDTEKIERYEGVEAFKNTVEYEVRSGLFSFSFLINYP